MIIGENQKFPAALIVPNFNYLERWCKTHGVSFGSQSDIIKKENVLQAIQQEIDKYNIFFGNAEQVKKFKLLENEWTTATGELTATLKLRRKIIIEKFKSQIDDSVFDSR